MELAEAEAPLHNFGGMLGSGELDPVSSRSAPAERAGRLRRNSVVAKAPAVARNRPRCGTWTDLPIEARHRCMEEPFEVRGVVKAGKGGPRFKPDRVGNR